MSHMEEDVVSSGTTIHHDNTAKQQEAQQDNGVQFKDELNSRHRHKHRLYAHQCR